MKAFIVLAVFLASASAGAIGLGHVGVGLANTGSSVSSRQEDGLGNYAFSYQEQGPTGGSSRTEAGSPGIQKGSYSLGVIDGRQRIVDYVADGLGFRASIRTNEPGTAPLAPASTSISAPDSVGIAVATARAAAPTLAGLAAAPAYGYGLAAAPALAPLGLAAAPALGYGLAAPAGLAYAGLAGHGALLH